MHFRNTIVLFILFFLGCYSFQPVAFVAHLAQHSNQQLQTPSAPHGQQLHDFHLKVHECKYCTFFKGHPFKVLFDNAYSLVFENLSDIAFNFFCLPSIVFQQFSHARAPPFLV